MCRLEKFSGRALAAAVALILAACGHGPLFEENQSEAAAETESVPKFPAFPVDARLIKADLGGPFEYSIDPESISVAKGIVFYTVVARSSAGALNVRFEGIRCGGRERKLYASGRSDGNWAAVRNPEWESGRNAAGSYYVTIADVYFCPNKRPVADAAEAIGALKNGRHPDTVPKP